MTNGTIYANGRLVNTIMELIFLVNIFLVLITVKTYDKIGADQSTGPRKVKHVKNISAAC